LESFAKSKGKWSHELKHATSHYYENVKSLREANRKLLAHQTWNVSATLPGRWRL